MNLPFFIARRIAFSGGKNFSRVIIRIATVAVTLSVAVMIASTALIAGFKHEISRKIFEFWGHIHISDTAYSLSFEPAPIEQNQDFYPSIDTVSRFFIPADEDEFADIIPDRERGRLGKWLNLAEDVYRGASKIYKSRREKDHWTYGGVKHIQVFAHKPGIIRTKTAMEGIILKGIGKDFDWNNLKPYLLEGQPITVSDTAPSRDIIISRQTADRLQVGVGDRFIVNFVKEREQLRRRFQICGIYKTGLEEYDRKFALCDIRQTQELLGWNENQVAGFEIWLEDPRDLSDVEGINNVIYEEILPSDLLSTSIRSKFPAIFEWLSLQDLNEIVILGLMLAVAIVNMITALLVLVLERTTMIGVLKALGEKNARIRRIFLYYAAVITLTGMFWGNLLGLGFCFLQDKFRFIKLNEADYYLSYAPVKINWLAVAGVNAGTLVVTLLFLILPSLLVSKIQPVKAIQFK